MNGIPIVGELLYTSAPRGIRHNGQGFTTVQVTSQLDPRLADALESLSAYHAIPSDTSSQPINFMHLRMNTPFFRGHVLSRIGPGDRELSLRSNKLAHHVAIPRHPLPSCSPLTLATSPALLSHWDQRVCELPLRTLPPPSQLHLSPAPARTWENLLGDAGWAGQILEWALNHHESTWIVFDDSHPTLRLMQELLALLPSRDTWHVTFATHFANLPTSVDCRLRWIHARSPEFAKLKQRSAPFCINLVTQQCSQPLANSSPWIQAARLGHALPLSQDTPSPLQSTPRKRDLPRFDPTTSPPSQLTLPLTPSTPFPLDGPNLDLPTHSFSPLPASRPFPLWIILFSALAGSLLLGMLAASLWFSTTVAQVEHLSSPPNPINAPSQNDSDPTTQTTPHEEPNPSPVPTSDPNNVANSPPTPTSPTTPEPTSDQAPLTTDPIPPSPTLTQLHAELPKLQLATSLGPQKIADFPPSPDFPFEFLIDGQAGLPEGESFELSSSNTNHWFIYHRNLANEEHRVAEVLYTDQQLQFQWNSWAETDLARSQRLGNTRWTFQNAHSTITLQLTPSLIDGLPLKCRDIVTQSTFLPMAIEPSDWKIYFDALYFPPPISIDAFKPLHRSPITWDARLTPNPVFFVPFQDDSDPPFEVGLRIQPELIQQERGLSIKWKGSWFLGDSTLPPSQWPAWTKPGLDSLFKLRAQRLGLPPSNSISKELDNVPAPLKTWYQDFSKKYLAQNNLYLRIRVVDGEYLLGRTP